MIAPVPYSMSTKLATKIGILPPVSGFTATAGVQALFFLNLAVFALTTASPAASVASSAASG